MGVGSSAVELVSKLSRDPGGSKPVHKKYPETRSNFERTPEVENHNSLEHNGPAMWATSIDPLGNHSLSSAVEVEDVEVTDRVLNSSHSAYSQGTGVPVLKSQFHNTILPAVSALITLCRTYSLLEQFVRQPDTPRAEMEKKSVRVLSIQSHVVSGYVGNKSATFPLQLLGFEVDAINSVQFSNHTGYGFWKGQILQQDELDDLMKGLMHNGLDSYSHLLTGYIRDAGFLRRIADVIKQLRKVNPSVVYVCDPVMGDNGRLYVPKDLVPIYKNEIVPLANIIAPNQFELEVLVDRPLQSFDDALKAIEHIHEMGVEIVFLSSTAFGKENELISIVSRKKGEERKVFKISVPRLPASFTGTGDLSSALFLAWYAKTGDLQATLENTMATMHAVLKRTFQTARSAVEGDNPTVASLELRIIQSKVDIENPTCTIAAESVNV